MSKNEVPLSTVKKAGRWKLFAVLAVCAAPMIASYISYYFVKPSGKTNYGTILDPRLYPQPLLNSQTLDGKAMELSAFKGKWIMLQVDSGACAASCQKKLLDMRQLRTIQGKEMERIERVWLITDEHSIDANMQVGIQGTRLLKASSGNLEKWLPVDTDSRISDHIYLIDPLGNLMMRFPKNADANKMKKDLSKLLKASAIG
ncbi:MAG: cytochrome C oxidase subunit I [Undibacterium sp.]|nr:cytochrome C oxidase subunit I [Undibacterium sp.]